MRGSNNKGEGALRTHHLNVMDDLALPVILTWNEEEITYQSKSRFIHEFIVNLNNSQ
jgi:hypothetical protein